MNTAIPENQSGDPDRRAVSLQRRLLLYLLISALLVWAVALGVSINRAQHSVNELFDTELIRLARQVQGVANAVQATGPAVALAQNQAPGGAADLSDIAIAVWDSQGKLVLSDREGSELPRHSSASGFTDETLHGTAWRIYYLHSASDQSLVAAGQKAYERSELVIGLTATQIVPWLFVLPVLLAVLAWAIRQALVPVHEIARELQKRKSDELQPINQASQAKAPAEIRPLLHAMNSLFSRVEATLTRERRFTADAAHELRTPLAVLRAQWDVVRRSEGEVERASSEAKFSAGLDRMDRLVTQLLVLSRVESHTGVSLPRQLTAPVHWPAIVEQVISDCLPIADRRKIDIACEWPDDPATALAMPGDEQLMTVLLRNLMDNAVRYASSDSLVTLRLTADELTLENDGIALPLEEFARLGERFHRPEAQQEAGSGLGVSIVMRIARLHGLCVAFGPGRGGRGVKVVVNFDRDSQALATHI